MTAHAVSPLSLSAEVADHAAGIVPETGPPFRYDLVVIGVSAGGLNALNAILPKLPADLRPPVLIVQHLSPDSDGYLVEHFNRRCALPVREGESQLPLQTGITLAPPSYHLLVSDLHTLDISSDERVNWSRPSIDVLFESAAWAFGPRLITLTLTGANHDGAAGACYAAARGAWVLVQNPASAEVAVMPQATLDAVPSAEILELEAVAERLISLSQKRNP